MFYKLNNLMEEFDNLDLKDADSVLFWLLKVYYVNDEFVLDRDTSIKGTSKKNNINSSCIYVYNKLLDAGYKPFTEDINASKEFIKNKSENKSQSAFIVLEQVMPFLKGNVGVDSSIVKPFIFNYNLTHHRKETLNIMLKELKELKGRDIKYTWVHNIDEDKTSNNISEGNLKEIEIPSKNNLYSGYVQTGDIKVPFVGETAEIRAIYDDDGNIIYYNNLINDSSYKKSNINLKKEKLYEIKSYKKKSNKVTKTK